MTAAPDPTEVRARLNKFVEDPSYDIGMVRGVMRDARDILDALASGSEAPPVADAVGMRSGRIDREMTAELDRRRVLTLAKLSAMLDQMARDGMSLYGDGTTHDIEELYGEVLMALGIEDEDNPGTMAAVIVEMNGNSGHGILDRIAPPVAGMGEGLVKRLKLAVDRFHASPSWPFEGRNITDLEKLLAALTKPAPPEGAGGSIPARMVPWHGGDSAPEDWDGGPALHRDHGIVDFPKNDEWRDGRIIAYTPKAYLTPPASVSGEVVVVSALIDALHISQKLSCDDRIAILREAQRLSGLAAAPEAATPSAEGWAGLLSFIEGWNQACISIAPGSGYHPEDRAQAWREFAGAAATSERCARCDITRDEAKHRDWQYCQNGPLVSDIAPHEFAPPTSIAIGSWLSAALDDPKVCDAMKADINAWFAAGMPPPSAVGGVDRMREAIERFIADYDDGDRADAGNCPLMEAHVADFRAALEHQSPSPGGEEGFVLVERARLLRLRDRLMTDGEKWISRRGACHEIEAMLALNTGSADNAD